FRANDLLLDSTGNIYVLDAGNSRVQKYDPDGGYLQTIGKAGQGPGELNSPVALAIDGQKNLFVAEAQKMHVFDESGNFKRSYSLEHRLSGFFVNEDGGIVVTGAKRVEEGTRQVVVLMDEDGHITRTLQEFSDVKIVTKKGEGAVTSFKAYHQYSNALSRASSEDGGILYGYPTEYKIYKAARDGSPILFFTRNIQPEMISSAEKDRIIETMEDAFSQRGYNLPRDVLEQTCQFPPHKPFFRGLRCDDEGRIYVMLTGSVLQQDAPVILDIFSRDGFYLYRTSLPFNPEIIRSGYAYDIFTSQETGDVRINRYRIKNWDQIRKESGI
ncbi:MAG: 6-bladed beta-propeller, partial [Candidatus Aminicenantes bacterium]|nr:6-bladed beta-propeller [Candidatus Aminicenantes bacterium]